MTAEKSIGETATKAINDENKERRNGLIRKWYAYCQSHGADELITSIGAGLIKQADRLDDALEFGYGYVTVRGNSFTLRLHD